VEYVNGKVINRVVSLSTAARNILYNYKMFSLGIDLTTKLTINFTSNSIFNKT
jgi:hypothetical protein